MTSSQSNTPKLMYIPRPDRKGKSQTKINALSFALLTKHLLDGDLTRKELAEETGLHYVTVLRYCRALRKVGALYINDWRTDARGNSNVAVFKSGSKPDAPKRKKSKAEIGRDYRQRKAMKELIHITAGQLREAA